MGRKAGTWLQTTNNITIMGTDRNMPGMPQTAPQNANDKMIPNADSRNARPIIKGSMTLPLMN